MAMLQLIKEMAYGAGVAGLDIAGSIAFPEGAWKIIKGLLDPILERLRKQLDIEDPFDAKHANESWAIIERDKALCKQFEEKLHSEVEIIKISQQNLTEGQQRLIQAVEGNSETLDVIKQSIKNMESNGVLISDKSIDTIGDIVQRTISEQTKNIDQNIIQQLVHWDQEQKTREQKVVDTLMNQLSRTQVRVVELLNSGDTDRAINEIISGFSDLQNMINEYPDNLYFRLQAGYFYKTIAATFLDAGKPDISEDFNTKAMRIFYLIAHSTSLNSKTVLEHVGALNGVGNILYARGEYTQAIDYYNLATQIYPGYFYAWHDMFFAYYALARQGIIDYKAMRLALENTRKTGISQPGLGEKYLKNMESYLNHVDPARIMGFLLQESTKRYESIAEYLKQVKPRKPREPVSDTAIDIYRIATISDKETSTQPLLTILDEYNEGRSNDNRLAALAAKLLGDNLAKTDAETAKDYYLQAIKLDPDDHKLHYELASFELQNGRIDKANESFLRAAILAVAEDNIYEAANYLEEVASICLKDENRGMLGLDIYRGLLSIYFILKEYDRLFRIYDVVINIDLYTGNYIDAEQCAIAARNLAKKLQEQFKIAHYIYQLGMIKQAKGDTEAAREIMLEAKSLYENLGEEPMVTAINAMLQ